VISKRVESLPTRGRHRSASAETVPPALTASGPVALTDELWLAAHDTPHGGRTIPQRRLGLGLATGILAELLLADTIRYHDDELFLPSRHQTTDPSLSAAVAQLDNLEKVRNPTGSRAPARARDPRVLIRYLAREERAATLVTDRLRQRGYLRAQPHRTFGGGRARYAPANSFLSGLPATRIRGAVQRREQLSRHDLALAGLFLLTGLHHRGLPDLSKENQKDLVRQMGNVAPELSDLLEAAASLSASPLDRRVG
jgi:Golgi phosphoprotein 3 (GPP34)